LPDGVFDRLQLLAIQRRKTISAVATEILDRTLPRLRIERED
jgi:AmiR/NasT family two-component response regulator